MIVFCNIEKANSAKQMVCSSLPVAVDKILTLANKSKLKPIYGYMASNKPPLHYCFFDKKGFVPCFAYIQHDDIKLARGNEECQINSGNLERIITTLKSADTSKSKNKIELFLRDNGVTQKDQFNSRSEALLEVLDYYHEEIVSKQFFLQYFYNAYHLPPSMFHLFSRDGSPTGNMVFLKNDVENFEDFSSHILELVPLLAKYSMNSEVL